MVTAARWFYNHFATLKAAELRGFGGIFTIGKG
jgi:hypothetical protein